MFDFNKEIINGSLNKVNKAGKDASCLNVNVKTMDKSVDVTLS